MLTGGVIQSPRSPRRPDEGATMRTGSLLAAVRLRGSRRAPLVREEGEDLWRPVPKSTEADHREESGLRPSNFQHGGGTERGIIAPVDLTSPAHSTSPQRRTDTDTGGTRFYAEIVLKSKHFKYFFCTIVRVDNSCPTSTSLLS